MNRNPQEILLLVTADRRYAEGITYGKPRKGHGEGTVRAHIEELERTVGLLCVVLGLERDEFWKLKLLVHVHDTFKKWAKRDSPIDDLNSHATLATKFLAEFTDDQDLLDMVQWHDENFALWKQFVRKGAFDHERLSSRVLKIQDIELFLIFTIVDGYTASKMSLNEQEQPEKLRWFVDEVNRTRAVPRAYAALKALGL